MPNRHNALGALLLALVFLLAQFHFCADLSSGSNTTHACPFCSTVSAAIATDVPILEIGLAATRLNIAAPQIETATTVAPCISPRAPPAL